MPNGSELSEPNVVVEDLLITAFGDSFASGESNPDRPVVFSASREILYDPNMVREDIATRTMKPQGNFDTASANGVDPRVLPRRLMADEEKDLMYRLTSSEFEQCLPRGAGALAQRRLPPFAIWLAVPRRAGADAGEPPPRGDADVVCLLGRRGDRRSVPAVEGARGPSRLCAPAVRSAQRFDLPRR